SLPPRRGRRPCRPQPSRRHPPHPRRPRPRRRDGLESPSAPPHPMTTPTDHLPESEQPFLRDLVKATRQRTHVVPWTDRDGTRRQTTLTSPENARLTTLAHQLGISKTELLQRA